MGRDVATTVPLPTAYCPGAYSYQWAWLTFNPLDKSFWAAAPPSCVEVITYSPQPSYNLVNFNVTAAYPVGQGPFGVAVDTSRGNVYVTNSGSDNVTIIDGATGTTVANIPVGLSPYGVAYDSVTDRIYVANGGSDNLSIISGSSEMVVGSVGVGSSPIGVAIDPATSQIFVANSGSGNVSVIATSNDTVVANLVVGQSPYGVALDNVTDQLYVTNLGDNTVSVIDAWNDSVTVTIGIGLGMFPEGVAYNPVNQLVWVGSTFYLVLINTTTQSVLGYLTTDPSGVAVDPNTGVVCASNTANASLRCMSYPVPLFPGALLQFVESGLPGTFNWSVTLYWPGFYRSTEWNESSGRADSVYFYVFAPATNSYTYVVPPVGGYYATAPTGTLSVSDNLQVNVTFVPLSSTFPVTFAESGLPSGTSWSVTLGGTTNGSVTSLIGFREPNGTFAYSFGSVPGFATSPSNGTLSVNGSALLVLVAFQTAAIFPVQFVENGLPTDYPWAASLDGTWRSSNTSVISFWTYNGTHSFTVEAAGWFSPQPNNGTVVVAGSPVVVPVQFTGFRVSYQVWFNETGLASGELWGIQLGYPMVASTSSSILLVLGNGTYSYQVAGPLGYTSVPASSSITVLGRNAVVPIVFTPRGSTPQLAASIDYSVRYASCLPDGSVTNYVLLGANVSGGVPPYSYAWNLPTGPASGPLSDTTTTWGQSTDVSLNVTDANHNATHQSVTLPMWLPPCPPPGPKEAVSAGPSTETWAILGLSVGLGLMTGLAVLFGLRSRGRPPTPPPAR